MAKRSSVVSNLENTVEAIGGALGSVLGTIRYVPEKVVSISGEALGTAKETLQNTSERFQQVAGDLRTKASDLMHSASDMSLQARRSLHRTQLRTRLYVAENPAKAVAIVAGAAFLGGFILGLKGRRRRAK